MTEMSAKSIPLAILLQLLLFCGVMAANDTWVVIVSARFASCATSNFRIQVGASRYWFNYRHVTNAYAIYRMAREQGVPDSHVWLQHCVAKVHDRRNRSS